MRNIHPSWHRVCSPPPSVDSTGSVGWGRHDIGIDNLPHGMRVKSIGQHCCGSPHGMRSRGAGPFYVVALLVLLVGGPAGWPNLLASRPRAAGPAVRGRPGRWRPPQAWAGAGPHNEEYDIDKMDGGGAAGTPGMGRGLGVRAPAPGPGAGTAQGVGDACSAGQGDFGAAAPGSAGLTGGASASRRTALVARHFDRRRARRAAIPGVGITDARAGVPSLAEVLRPACVCVGAMLSWLGRGDGSRGLPRRVGRDDR
eukprot:1393417-Alexandrium_andersonii.AAC.1